MAAHSTACTAKAATGGYSLARCAKTKDEPKNPIMRQPCPAPCPLVAPNGRLLGAARGARGRAQNLLVKCYHTCSYVNSCWCGSVKVIANREKYPNKTERKILLNARLSSVAACPLQAAAANAAREVYV